MELFNKLIFKKKLRIKGRKNTLNEIRNNLAKYACKQISIIECVSKTGPLTVDLIYRLSSEKTKKSVHDSILIMITNYYVMLHMDMYTGFYSVNRKHTYSLIFSLVEDILDETAKQNNGLIPNNSDMEFHKSRDFTKEMVEVYYRAGIDGCHRYVATSVYSALLSENRNLSVKRDWVEHIVREIQAEKFLTGSYDDTEFSLESTG